LDNLNNNQDSNNQVCSLVLVRTNNKINHNSRPVCLGSLNLNKRLEVFLVNLNLLVGRLGKHNSNHNNLVFLDKLNSNPNKQPEDSLDRINNNLSKRRVVYLDLPKLSNLLEAFLDSPSNKRKLTPFLEVLFSTVNNSSSSSNPNKPASSDRPLMRPILCSLKPHYLPVHLGLQRRQVQEPSVDLRFSVPNPNNLSNNQLRELFYLNVDST
jgi:hypothetical protein